MILSCELEHLFVCVHLVQVCCHMNLNIFYFCELIIVYVCTWIIFAEFICILNRYIKNNDFILDKIL